MVCNFKKINLHFKKPGGTSRGVLHDKSTYLILLEENGKTAYGECNRFVNLSFDDRPNYNEKLQDVCKRLPSEKHQLLEELTDWPSIYFGVETVLKDWENGSEQIIFPEVIGDNGFSIPTNGLIWMGPKDDMRRQIINQLEKGYTSIKLKVGAIDFESELELIRYIRKDFTIDEVEVRLDANGAFTSADVMEKLHRLSDYGISYIEQPIKAGNWEAMATICELSPIKIALDEELIGIQQLEQRQKMVDTISPHLLILKPALIGGFHAANQWKKIIEESGGSWVITSALESNIGLNAIAQYTALGWTDYAQGLGTGQLFTNNFPSPYTVDAQGLHYHIDKKWDFSSLI